MPSTLQVGISLRIAFGPVNSPHSFFPGTVVYLVSFLGYPVVDARSSFPAYVPPLVPPFRCCLSTPCLGLAMTAPFSVLRFDQRPHAGLSSPAFWALLPSHRGLIFSPCPRLYYFVLLPCLSQCRSPIAGGTLQVHTRSRRFTVVSSIAGNFSLEAF